MKKKLIFFGIIICIIIGYIFIKVSNNYEPSRSIERRVKSTIFQMRSQAEIIYQKSSPGSYENLCSDNETKSLLSNIKKITIKCFSDSDSWVVAVNVNVKKTSSYYCSDSNISEEINEAQYNSIMGADTLCGKNDRNTIDTQPVPVVENDANNSCKMNSDCSCKNFNGATFIPGSTPGQCDLETNTCKTCYYR